MESEKIKIFIEKFFINLGANVLKEDNSFIVSNVPENFEKFYGKKSPYKFVFRVEDKNSENEFIEQGNYLLKTMSNFLEDRGKTTLLKINFEVNPEKEIEQRIKLNNCKIEKLIPKRKHNFFFRFTFHTTFQYLNEKEKMINEIYVYDNEIIDGDLSSYNIIEGNKKDVVLPDIKEPYDFAKEKVKELIRPKALSLSEELGKRIEKEIDRINNHFAQENSELGRKNHEEEILKKKSSEFEKDKLREIEIEKQRHSLNMGTKLFNTTLIYYPVFTYDCFLNKNSGKRIIEISYDPLLDKMNELFCENCNAKIDEIHFCSSGHIACKKCFSKCGSCSEDYCAKCLNILCEQCGEKICKKCSIRCFSCGKMVCKNHATQDKISEKFYCANCLQICERCGQKKEPVSFKISKRTQADICEDCFRKEMSESVVEGIFGKED